MGTNISGYALATAMMMALAAPAQAQEAPAPAKQADNDAIIVTARRTEEKLQDVPISITVLSKDTISKLNIFSAGDLGNYVPSLATSDDYGPEKASFSIRGFVQEQKTAPSVAVYFADVVALRSNGSTTAGNGAGVGSFLDLQNVQVLKGPQGTLFGRNTTGGAILLVPAKPTGKLEGSVEGSVGDYNLRRVQAVLNVPLSDTFRVRGAVDWNKRDGYLINKSGIGPNALGNTDYVAARLSIVGDLTPNLESYTIISYSKSHNNGTIAKLVGCNTAAAAAGAAAGVAGVFSPLACGQLARENARGDGFWDVDNPNAHPFERVNQWQVINTTKWNASDTLTIKNIASYGEYRERSSFNLWGDNFLATGAPINILGFFNAPTVPGEQVGAINVNPGASGIESAESTFTEELQFQGRTTNGRFNWQAGAYLEVSNPLAFNSSYTSIFNTCTNVAAFQCNNPLAPILGTISDTNTKDTFNDKGLYSQATFKMTDQLSLTGGIRYTIDRQSDENREINIFPPTIYNGQTTTFACQNVIKFPGFRTGGANGPVSAQCDDVIKIESKRPTWLVDLDYKPTADLLLYAKWSRGYRAGGINATNIGVETWAPEKVDTFEGGSKFSFHGPMPGYFDIAGFYNNFRNQQLAVNTNVQPAEAAIIQPIQAIENVGKSRIWGVEIDAAIRPFAGLKLNAGYTYLNTKLLTAIPIPPSQYYIFLPTGGVGDPLALAPKNRFTLTGNYTLPLDQTIGQISVGATFTHTDSNLSEFSQGGAPDLYRIPAVNLLNLNADWDSVFGKPLDLSFFMTNATNQKVILAPAGGYQTIGADAGYNNLPRMFGFRAKIHFGS